MEPFGLVDACKGTATVSYIGNCCAFDRVVTNNLLWAQNERQSSNSMALPIQGAKILESGGSSSSLACQNQQFVKQGHWCDCKGLQRRIRTNAKETQNKE